MNFKQLRAFREVMQTGSLSEASRRLYRSQPAISALINSLEADIGFKLFLREGMRLKPVSEAYYLLKEATQILEHLDNTERTLKSIKDRSHGELRIVSMPGPSVHLLPDLIDRFMSDRNLMKVSLISKTSPQVKHLISAQQFDIGFADLEQIPIQDTSLVNYEVFEFDCLCALKRDDPLASQDVITPHDLNGKPMAALFEDHSTHIQVVNAFVEAGVVFNQVIETQFFLPMFTFIERGQAYAIVDRLSAESYRFSVKPDQGAVVFRPFKPRVRMITAVMTPAHSPLSLLAQEFLKNLREMLSKIQTSDF